MSETVIPTMALRYILKQVPLRGRPDFFESKRCLQQRFDKPSGGYVWRDVPTVEETE